MGVGVVSSFVENVEDEIDGEDCDGLGDDGDEFTDGCVGIDGAPYFKADFVLRRGKEGVDGESTDGPGDRQGTMGGGNYTVDDIFSTGTSSTDDFASYAETLQDEYLKGDEAYASQLSGDALHGTHLQPNAEMNSFVDTLYNREDDAAQKDLAVEPILKRDPDKGYFSSMVNDEEEHGEQHHMLAPGLVSDIKSAIPEGKLDLGSSFRDVSRYVNQIEEIIEKMGRGFPFMKDIWKHVAQTGEMAGQLPKDIRQVVGTGVSVPPEPTVMGGTPAAGIRLPHVAWMEDGAKKLANGDIKGAEQSFKTAAEQKQKWDARQVKRGEAPSPPIVIPGAPLSTTPDAWAR